MSVNSKGDVRRKLCQYSFYSHILPLISPRWAWSKTHLLNFNFTLALILLRRMDRLAHPLYPQPYFRTAYFQRPTSSAASDEAQVVESGHLALDGGRGVAELRRVVLVIPSHHRHQGPVGDVAHCNHLGTGWKKIHCLQVRPYPIFQLLSWKPCW